ncbi:MAG: hypothetical protein SWO11_23230 [Thermodesulfobacteriota bacterium]|nr:hypothetical protein [Thermodesulfobacteriota bacterium]
MNTEIHYDKNMNLINQKLHGLCSIHNLAEVFDDMEKYELKPGLKILADITDADLKDTNYDSVSFLEKKLDEFLDKYLPIRKAIIVESDLEFGIARMYEMLAEKDGFDVRVFYNKSEAMDWLKS